MEVVSPLLERRLGNGVSAYSEPLEGQEGCERCNDGCRDEELILVMQVCASAQFHCLQPTESQGHMIMGTGGWAMQRWLLLSRSGLTDSPDALAGVFDRGTSGLCDPVSDSSQDLLVSFYYVL